MQVAQLERPQLIVEKARVREVAETRDFYAQMDEMRPPNAPNFYAQMDEMRPPNAPNFYAQMDEMRPPNAPR
jgi:hypothetical protein